METITIYEKSMGKSHIHRPGEVMRHWIGYGAAAKLQYVTVVSMTKKLCRCEEPWSDDYEGQVWKNIITARPSTDDEARPLLEQDQHRARAKAILARVTEIGRTIEKTGEYPAGLHDPVGDVLFDTMNIYGGGERFVVGPEYIWYLVNNGMDGDCWARNNVRTGGAGAIGHRIPYNDDLAREIRQLDAELKTIKAKLEG